MIDPVDAPATDRELEELLSEYLLREETEGESALGTLCERRPELADRLRSHVAAARRLGFTSETRRAFADLPEKLGEFRLIRRLGEGGMGVVYLAEQTALKRTVALKLVRPEHLYFSGARERFRREVEAVARMRHPAIVRIHTVGEAEGIPYFAMEWVEGASLAEVVARLHASSPEKLTAADLSRAIQALVPGALPLPDGEIERAFGRSWVDACFRIATQIADALEHAHGQGVIHRDVKPSNVMIAPDGRVTVLDFGLARAAGSQEITRTGAQLGSLAYMAPEQVRGADVDSRADVYAVGVVLHELLTLRSPFLERDAEATRRRIVEGAPPSIAARNRAVPYDAETVCRTAMDREPSRRYASAEALARDLRNVVDLRPVEARRAGPALRALRWTQRHPSRALAIALASILAVATPALWLVKESAARERARAEQRLDSARAAADLMGVAVAESQANGEDPAARTRFSTAAFRFLAGQVKDGAEDPALRVELARAYHDLALTLIDVEHMQEALDAFRKSIDMLEPIVRARPEEEVARRELARSRSGITRPLRDLGRLPEALESVRAAREEFERRHREKPDDRGEWRALATIGWMEGQVMHDLGRYPEAVAAFRERLGYQRTMLEGHPEAVADRARTAAAMWAIGRSLRMSGALAEAETSLRDAVATLEETAKAGVDTPWCRRMGALACDELGLVAGANGRAEEAESWLRRAVDASGKTVPDLAKTRFVEYREARAVARLELGSLLLAQSRVDEAAPEIDAALEMAERIEAELPDVTTHPHLLARAKSAKAQLQAARGDRDGATTLAAEALALASRAVELAPDHAEYRAQRERLLTAR